MQIQTRKTHIFFYRIQRNHEKLDEMFEFITHQIIKLRYHMRTWDTQVMPTLPPNTYTHLNEQMNDCVAGCECALCISHMVILVCIETRRVAFLAYQMNPTIFISTVNCSVKTTLLIGIKQKSQSQRHI